MTSVGSATWRHPAVKGPAFTAAGRTDPGVQREVNEDRFHADAARGLFIVVDGVGGQAAGGRAADVALSMIRQRLERESGRVADRIREAIAVANNEIHRLAATRAEWNGMACVLTIAVVNDGTVTIGHVGDTRLYRLRNGRIDKITRDHSPVGEREDAGELSESQAMRHPRRNEVYRDVGSERHEPGDADFIDVAEMPFAPDSALLLCTDGLTDLVDSTAISGIVDQWAGDPEAVVSALIDAANGAGGKDNITALYVEGEQFADARSARGRGPTGGRATASARAGIEPEQRGVAGFPAERPRARWLLAAGAMILVLAAAVGVGLARAGVRLPWSRTPAPAALPAEAAANVRVVQPGGSIADAIRDAAPDSEIIVEPGEYREQLVLKDRVRLVSRVPRAATIRLPATAPDSDLVPAVVATGLSRAELAGFRVVGDAATPLSIGIRVENSALAIVDVELTGATKAAVEFSGAAAAALVGSDVRDNPGSAMIVHEGAAPRIAHNVFARNSTSERAAGAVLVMKGAAPALAGNVFLGLTPDSFATLDPAARAALKNENWFVPVSAARRANRGTAPNRPLRIK